MGVLAHRLHGSVTALAAMAALSLSSDSSDRSGLRLLSCETGQSFLLSSDRTPTEASSVNLGVSLSSSPSMDPALLSQPPLRSQIHAMPVSPFASQTSSLCFHRAQSTTTESERCVLRRVIMPVQGGLQGANLHSMDYKPSLLINAAAAQTGPLEFTAHVRWICWKLPVIARSWHSRYSGHHSMEGDFLVPRPLHMARLDELFSPVRGAAHVIPPMASAFLLHMCFPSKTPESNCNGQQVVKHKPTVAVVLLGWLGAEQRHLKKYAEWYTSQGIHAVTFVVPMRDLLTLKAGDNAEKHVDVLAQNLVQWLEGDMIDGNKTIVIFHTFSNTGWLIYGAVLERLVGRGDDLMERIKGCVVDSAPSARPDPHVWASGFSAALLKKGSVATKMLQPCVAEDWNGVDINPKPSFKETALLAMLENFFSIFLQIPNVNRRLNDVVTVLANQQPACPQLYIYSSADAVIPAKSVESFIEEQKKAGHAVKACDFQFSPHVDHFRTFPERYIEQLTSFLKLCVPQWATR